jgi:Condensation domain
MTIGRQEVYVVPASYAQQRLWVMEQIEDGAPTYNLQVGLRLRGDLNVSVLQRAFDAVVDRHETLRTCLAVEHGELTQVISARAQIPISVEELNAGADPEVGWRRRAAEELLRPFDVFAELPLRAHLFRLADNDHVFLLSMDHIACDAWSARILHHELVTF